MNGIKDEHDEQTDLIALLIDSDNTQYKKIETIIRKVSTFGRILIKRAYGNWNKDALKKWNDIFGKYAVKPIHQIDYTTGKNATDIALVIDAMDFLYTSKCSCFAIVSGDSDFTPLALKIRETGNKVIGIGLKNSSKAFINACDEFIPIEELSETAAEAKNGDSRNDRLLVELLKMAAESYQDDDGYTNVSAAGQFIKRVNPDFDIKVYGASKLSEFLMKSKKDFETRRRKGKNGVNVVEYKVNS